VNDVSDLKWKPGRIQELWDKFKDEGSLTGVDFLEYAFLVKVYWE